MAPDRASAADRDSRVEDTLGAARALADTIARRAAEIERTRRVPSDLLHELIAAGCFRVLLPESHGGFGADLSSAMRLFETLARADASVGWTVMIGAGCWLDLVGLPRRSFDALFAARPHVITAGVFNPSGSIAAENAGYRVTGRWSFASGCEHADWLFGNCVERVVDGAPKLRIAVFSTEQVGIEDTWHVSGLCGTGSHHFRVDGVFVPAERTLDPLADKACIDDAIARTPVPAVLSLGIASVAVGIAQGALDDVVVLAKEKTPLLAATTLAANAQFQFELACADTTLRAARALLYEQAESLWEIAVGSSQPTLEQRAHVRAAAVWATSRAVDVATGAYRAGGGSSLYAGCALQRRLRDVNAAAQHFLVRPDTFTTAGAILASQDVAITVF
jgi:alkylation response protein AidB-like acyl-CoA dehydrogenase